MTITMEDRIAARLNHLFAAAREAGKDNFQIKMKSDGTTLTLAPCFEDPDPAGRNFMSADHVLVYGAPVANMFFGDPEKLCAQLANYDALKASYAAKVSECRDYWKRHKDVDLPCQEDAFDFYSDWFKDLFGRRPKGWEEPIT